MSTEPIELTPMSNKLSKRNFWCFAFGAWGRDFLYNFFTSFLLSFILFTKHLTTSQFAAVTAIIIVARVFDAFNDPIMGGIIELTKTRWGKFRPYILVGAVTTAIVIVLLFSIPLDGWAFIGLLAVMYLMFSITFTMNDIAYWGMLPALARDLNQRNSLMSATSIIGGVGSGLCAFLVPMLTVERSDLLGGTASSAYMYIAMIAGLVMIVSQCITVFGVQDYSLPDNLDKKNKGLGIKKMFSVIKNNDQLLVSVTCLTLYSVGTGVVGGGLSMMYIYFKFGYYGLLVTIFGILSGFFGFLVILFFPAVVKKIGRTKVITAGAIITIIGYALLMVVGLSFDKTEPLTYINLLGIIVDMPLYPEFIALFLINGLIGFGQNCYYMLMFLNIANCVEYNEWKTGKREEGVIFALRPFSAKLSSALTQLLVYIFYVAVGVLAVTNGISDLDQSASLGTLDLSKGTLYEQVNALLATVSTAKSKALLCCMCITPMVFMTIGIILYRKKFILDEKNLARMQKEVLERKAEGVVEGVDCKISQEEVATAECIEEEVSEQVERDIAE